MLLETADSFLKHVVRVLVSLKFLLHLLHVVRECLGHWRLAVLGLLGRQNLVVVLPKISQCLINQTLRGFFACLMLQWLEQLDSDVLGKLLAPALDLLLRTLQPALYWLLLGLDCWIVGGLLDRIDGTVQLSSTALTPLWLVMDEWGHCLTRKHSLVWRVCTRIKRIMPLAVRMLYALHRLLLVSIEAVID